MQDLGLFLSILIGAVIGSVLVLLAYELGKRTAKIGYVPTSLERFSFEMAKSILTDIHSAALADNEKEMYSTDGNHQYETYEIPYCIAAIDKLLETTKNDRES